MWTYSTDAVALQAFDAPSVQEVTGVTINGQRYDDKYIFDGEHPVIENGRLALAGISVNGDLVQPSTVMLGADTLIAGGKAVIADGADLLTPDGAAFAPAGATLVIDDVPVVLGSDAVAVSRLSLVAPGTTLTLAHIANINSNTGKYELEQTSTLPAVSSRKDITLNYKTVLNPATAEYQNAGDWNGNLFAIQAIAAVLWAVVLGFFRRRKPAYSLSLLLGAVGFISVYFIHDQYMLAVSYSLMGCAWAAILSMPFTILTNALSGGNIGTYLGLFNCTITIPQIVAALCGGAILHCFPPAANGAPLTVGMLVVAGVLLLIASACVWIIKETYGSQTAAANS